MKPETWGKDSIAVKISQGDATILINGLRTRNYWMWVLRDLDALAQEAIRWNPENMLDLTGDSVISNGE